MGYIITTDTHLGHKNIMDFGKRPLGFEQLILENLEKMPKNNILIHLGDVAWEKEWYWNRQLTSIPFIKKWLVRGNHDKKSDIWYINNGWDFVGESITIDYMKTVVKFSHKPIEVNDGEVNIYGHFHDISGERISRYEPELLAIHNKPNHILLALEHHYTPYKLDNLLNGLYQ